MFSEFGDAVRDGGTSRGKKACDSSLPKIPTRSASSMLRICDTWPSVCVATPTNSPSGFTTAPPLQPFGIGAAVGGVLGGILGQKIYNQRPRNISLFMGGLQVFAVPLMWRIIDAEYTTANLHTNIVICLLAGVLASMAGTNVRFLLTNVNSPATRGFVMSIFDVFNNIGKGLGPLIVSWLVQRMGSRRIGYDMAMTAWWLDGAFMAATFFFVEEDERVAMGKGRKRVGGGFRGGRRDS